MDIMRTHFTVGLAGFNIDLDTVSTSTCVLCRDYLQDCYPDIHIAVTEEDVKKEYMSNRLARHNKVSAETTASYRKIVEALIDYNTFLMHGAVIAVRNSAYMFTAPSGIGKTTHIMLWLKNLPETIVVNGDKPLLKILDDSVMACGTPWFGNENMNSNVIKPLKSIVLLERSENNYIEEISMIEAYPDLLRQTYLPYSPEKARKVLSLLVSLFGKVSFYRFKCNNFKSDCFEVAYKALAGGYS